MTTARTDAELRERALTALRGDHITHLLPVVGHHLMRKPPRRRRPHSRVLPHGGHRPRPSAGVRVRGWLVGFFAWLTDPLQWLGDLLLMPFRGLLWLCRGKEKRRRDKTLNGGWDSTAGGLGIALSIWGPRMLAVGQHHVSLVYVGEHEAEIAWSVPREELTGVEHAFWNTYDDGLQASLRWHFRDGSWCDVRAQGDGWKVLVDDLRVR